MFIRKVIPIAIFLGAVACAHVHEVENTAEGIQVGIGGEEVKEGDRVSVFEQKCQAARPNRYTGGERCVDKKVGEAIVLKVIDKGTAIVSPQNGLIMNESMLVEKKGVSK